MAPNVTPPTPSRNAAKLVPSVEELTPAVRVAV